MMSSSIRNSYRPRFGAITRGSQILSKLIKYSGESSSMMSINRSNVLTSVVSPRALRTIQSTDLRSNRCNTSALSTLASYTSCYHFRLRLSATR